MKTYDYRCKDCENEFSIEFSMSKELDDNTLPTCPSCQSPNTQKIIKSAPTVVFKGSGCYSNDNKK